MNPKLHTFLYAAAILAAVACGKKSSTPVDDEEVFVDRESLVMYASDPKGAPADSPSTPEKVELGKMIFSEQKLAKAGDVSCASCHDPAKHFADSGKATSAGAGGAQTRRNAPGLVNASKNSYFFWDYRATTIEDAVLQHLKEITTYGFADEAGLTAKAKEIVSVKAAFQKAFPGEADPVNAANFSKAVGAYLRTLTVKTRFDAYLDGDDKALDNKEKRGLKLFTGVLNCTTCHNSRLVGGMLPNKFGTLKAYDTKDLGRYELTKKDEEKHMYKVPALTNVARTAPYFHDGSAKTLEEAVSKMSVHQFGREIKPEELADVVGFLSALNAK